MIEVTRNPLCVCRCPVQFPRFPEPTIDNPYGYIYIITNNLDGRSYVGQHCAQKFDSGYWGSGDAISAAIKKYGQSNFTRGVLVWVASKAEADTEEIYWIDLLDTFHGDGYNLTPGGGGCGSGPDNHAYGKPSPLRGTPLSAEHKAAISAFFKGRPFSDEHRKNLSLARQSWERTHTYSEEYRQKCSERNKGENNPMYGRRGENSPIYGRKLSLEHRQKISNWARTHPSSTARILYQYDLQGNFVREYPSIKSAYDTPEKYEATTLRKCCKFQRGERYVPYKGSYWSYAPPLNGKLPPLEVSIAAGK